MSFCPRCVQPIAPDATRCPNCAYDIAAAATTPSDQTRVIAPSPGGDSRPTPRFSEGPSQRTGPPEQRRRYWWQIGALVAAGLAVVALMAVLAANWIGNRGAADATPVTTDALTPTISSSGPPSTGTTASRSDSRTGAPRAADRRRGKAQASRIADYLAQSRRARHDIGAAIRATNNCTNIAPAVTTLRKAAAVRTRIVQELAGAAVGALPHGAAMVAELRQAMRTSANADRHYAGWGPAVAGCHRHAPHNADFAAAQRSDAAATAAKRRFAREWNPIAARYGLAKQNANTI